MENQKSPEEIDVIRRKSQIQGTDGPDLLFGDTNSNQIFGSGGNDTLFGDRNNDFLDGEPGNDSLRGGKDNDTLSGGSENDLLYGDRELDSCSGGLGNDTVYGGKGNDTLEGDSGNDLLSGDKGDDFLTGGIGADTFFFMFNSDGTYGTDTITDFDSAEGDLIGLDSSFNLPSGVLSSSEFLVIDNFLPNQSNGLLEAIIYDSVNRLIYFNETAGTGDEIPIARVSPGTQINAGDFEIF